jgi:RND family efflux transporter MFP subunit
MTTERTMDRPQTREDGNGDAHGNAHGDAQKHAPHADAGHDEIPKDLPRPSTATVLIVVGVFVLLLVALFIIGYVPHRHRVAEADADATERASTVPVVQVELPKRSAPTNDLTLPCDIKANQETAIYARSSGYLKKWYVDIQDRAQAGQLLAEIDAPEVDAQLAQSRAQLEQSKANVVRAESDLELAQKNLDRFLEAKKNSPGSVTEQQLDQMQAAFDSSRSALVQAKASVASAEADVQRLTVLQNFERVTAPFAGIITSRNYDVGALLNPSDTAAGKQMFSIAQTDPLRVFVNVPQSDATQVKIGQPVFLKVRNYPDREFTGEVARTAGAIDPTTRTMMVELHFPNKDLALVPGMYGQVRLPLHEAAPTLTIPTSALVFNADGLRVDVVRDGKIHVQTLQVGRDFGTEIEVASGLSEQDQVVTNPGEKLSEGAAVKAMEPKQAPNTRVAHAN